MEPVELIVTALVAGMSSGLAETTKTAIQDTYYALKAHLQKATSTHVDATQALANVENKPDSPARQAVLKEELINLKLDQDTDLLELAKKLLETFEQTGAQTGKYAVHIQHSQGIAIGDGAQVVYSSKNKKQ
jgi:hypothetical protein